MTHLFQACSTAVVCALATFAAPATFECDAAAPVKWSHDSVIAGQSVTVTIEAAECFPITVRMMVGDDCIGTYEVKEAPDVGVFTVPEAAFGKDYTVEVDCGGSQDSSTGQVS